MTICGFRQIRGLNVFDRGSSTQHVLVAYDYIYGCPDIGQYRACRTVPKYVLSTEQVAESNNDSPIMFDQGTLAHLIGTVLQGLSPESYGVGNSQWRI